MSRKIVGTVGSRVLDSLKMDRGDLIVGALGERAESATIMIDSAKVAFIHSQHTQHANGHTKHKTFTPRTHHTRFIQMLADM